MDTAEMLRRFEVLAEAPGGVDRVRQLVLEMAVRGRLVPQDPRDEPATALLARIAAERARLVKEKKIPKSDPLPPVGREEQPYALPEGWAWARLASLCLSLTDGDHLPPPQTPSGVPFLTIGNVRSGTIDFTHTRFVSPEYFNALEPWRKPTYGDILYTVVGSYGHAISVSTNRNFCVQRHIAIARPPDSISANYLRRTLNSKLVFDQARNSVTGIAQPTLALTPLRRFAIPLPPVAEQYRIVAKLDELMAWCDQLEQRLAARDAQRVAARASVLRALSRAPSETAPLTWERASRSWPALVQHADDVASLRRVVLELAVRGRLVPQDPSDEPAEALLGRIAAERARLVEEKKIPKSDPLPPVGEDMQPYELPTRWQWIFIADAFDVTGGLQKTPQRRPDKSPVPYLRVANVQRGSIDLEHLEYFEVSPDELDRCQLRRGDLLIIEGNGSLDEIGRCAIWAGTITPCVHQNHVIRCRPTIPGMEDFAEAYINSPSGSNTMKQLAITTSGLYSLSVGKIRSIVFPMPPLAEQRRIVAKVDELMALFDCLEASLRTQRASHDALAAAMARALAASA